MLWQVSVYAPKNEECDVVYRELIKEENALFGNSDLSSDQRNAKLEIVDRKIREVCYTPKDVLQRRVREDDIFCKVENLYKMRGLRTYLYPIENVLTAEAACSLGSSLLYFWKKNSLEHNAGARLSGYGLLKFPNEFKMKEIKRASDFLLFWSKKNFSFLTLHPKKMP